MAYTVLAAINQSYDNDPQAAARYLEQAFALSPNDTSLLLPAAAFAGDQPEPHGRALHYRRGDADEA